LTAWQNILYILLLFVLFDPTKQGGGRKQNNSRRSNKVYCSVQPLFLFINFSSFSIAMDFKSHAGKAGAEYEISDGIKMSLHLRVCQPSSGLQLSCLKALSLLTKLITKTFAVLAR
jgi:hypothetical protein